MDEPAGREAASAAEWEKLTWGDLTDWAGSKTVTRGRSYQEGGHVGDLCASGTGVLLAWVRGGRKYATRVHLDLTRHRRADRIMSHCSCPVGVACKHAVAVVLQYLDALERGAGLPEAPEDDERWTLLRMDDEELAEDVEDGDRFPEDGPLEESGPSPWPERGRRVAAEDLHSHLASKAPEDLADLIVHFCDLHPDLLRILEDERRAAEGDFSKLLQETRREMRSVTAEEAWWNGWKGQGHIPDFGGLESRLRMLVAHGQADAVVELGRELLKRGIDQVEHSHDEGEAAMGISGCMGIVADALLKSGLSPEEKILYAIESMLADNYWLCEDFRRVLDSTWEESAWSAVADRLIAQLEVEPPVTEEGDKWLRSFRREQLGDRAIEALDKGGRGEEGTRLCVAEARRAGSYPRAVRRLMDDGDFGGAESLAKDGLKETPARYQGIHNELQDLLCEMAEETGNPMLPAAVAAARFFDRPTVGGFRELTEKAKKAGCGEIVARGAMIFLETGQRPDGEREDSSESLAADLWPLPPAPESGDEAARRGGRSETGPHYRVLIDLAIEEKRPDDVLNWYDELTAAKADRHSGWRVFPVDSEEKIAEAVASSYPDRAITIFVEAADRVASETNTRTYPEAGRLLKRARQVLERHGRSGEWSGILKDFRFQHHRKWRLMEVLDGIEGRPIVKGRRK